ncbi:MAG: cupin domain-containing protein [Nostoc sp.]|uniref:cupin domain-containing protein n=1 Tax=Nostoc sp. TaxID=1180 RepID=UPI002FF5DB7E
MSINYKFSSLILPYTIEEFFQQFYEEKYLYIARNNEKYYDAILNSDDIDLFFQNKRLFSSELRVVKESEEIPAYKWSYDNSSIADNDRLFVLFNQGHTIIVRAGDRSIFKLANYCSDLERELKIYLQFKIYISPANSRGFIPHIDDHDVLILQTTGTKIWRLYHSPVKLPCSEENPSSPNYANKRYKGEFFHQVGIPQFEVELKPGDLLYIPRGLIHEALTTDTASVHININLYPNYWFQLFQEVVELAQAQPEFRRAIPNALMNEADKIKFKERFRQLTHSLIDNLDVDELLERKFDKFLSSKRFDDQNRFKDSILLNKLNLNSILSRRKNLIYKIDRDEKNVYVKFYNKKLDFPRFFEPSLKLMFQDECFAVKDIGELITDEGKIELATKFIQEGFLKIENINT